MNKIVPLVATNVHAPIAADVRASYCFFEFFTANIRDPNTRRAYSRSFAELFLWSKRHGLSSIIDAELLHPQPRRADIQAKLGAIRSLFDCLVTGQIMLMIRLMES